MEQGSGRPPAFHVEQGLRRGRTFHVELGPGSGPGGGGTGAVDPTFHVEQGPARTLPDVPRGTRSGGFTSIGMEQGLSLALPTFHVEHGPARTLPDVPRGTWCMDGACHTPAVTPRADRGATVPALHLYRRSFHRADPGREVLVAFAMPTHALSP